MNFLASSHEELLSATISSSKTNSRVCEIVLDLEVLLLDVADDTQPSFVILPSASESQTPYAVIDLDEHVAITQFKVHTISQMKHQ
jgi:hypothetical protein